MGSPACTHAHTHAVITQVFTYTEFLLGAGVSEETETALALGKHKFKSLGWCLPTHQICYSCLSQVERNHSPLEVETKCANSKSYPPHSIVCLHGDFFFSCNGACPGFFPHAYFSGIGPVW